MDKMGGRKVVICVGIFLMTCVMRAIGLIDVGSWTDVTKVLVATFVVGNSVEHIGNAIKKDEEDV